MKAADFRGLYSFIPTPTTADGDHWGARDTVDLVETERLVKQLIQDGSDGLAILGTTGECATITPAEFETMVDCVLATVNGRLPVFVGATAQGTHEVVQRARFARDRGATGVLLGLPTWQPLMTDAAVEYYKTIAAAFPDLAIMVYGNPRAFRFEFLPEFWERIVAEVPTVVATKYSRFERVEESLKLARGKVHFMPNETGLKRFFDLSPDTTTACWSTSASMGPEPSVALMRAVREGDAERQAAIAKDLAWAGQPLHVVTQDPVLFAAYNIQLEKTRIAEAGYCRPGPIRPPYNVWPEEYAEAARESGRRWRDLRKKYAVATTR